MVFVHYMTVVTTSHNFNQESRIFFLLHLIKGIFVLKNQQNNNNNILFRFETRRVKTSQEKNVHRGNRLKIFTDIIYIKF